jgi:hypothetical protein
MAPVHAVSAILLLALVHGAAADNAQDRIEISQDADRLMVVVYHAKGIGGAVVNAPESVWPPVVLVRLRGFPELENFSAASRAAKLECALNRPEGRPPAQACRLDGVDVEALRHGPDGFEVRLPAALLTTDDGPIAMRWVDQWR